jgi:iron donor protein CyaY
MKDYQERTYLSVVEVAKYLNLSVKSVERLIKKRKLKAKIAASGQRRFALADLQEISQKAKQRTRQPAHLRINIVQQNNTTQTVVVGSSTHMKEVADDSVHLVVTSPPYFNAKMYSREPIENNLGDVHDIDEWFEKIGQVWRECFRVMQPGRKIFINIMNLPVRLDGGGYRTLNLVGRTIDLCEEIGFIFKRDIVWQKTNGVRAHFGTYPYPGGILINNMHEFILEFDKPNKLGANKYAHLTKKQKEQSKLDKTFWLSIKNSDVWLMKPEKSGQNRTHVAPFPKELPYRLIRAFSYVGETVLDPFLGSGTTCIVAAELGRNGIGYELNPEIAKDAVSKIGKTSSSLFCNSNQSRMNIPVEIDKTLSRLSNALDKLNRDDFEYEEAEGKLTIEFEDRVKLIVSRQSASNQIWLAEPGGGWKFDYKAGQWICDKRGITLEKALSDLLSQKLGEPISL